MDDFKHFSAKLEHHKKRYQEAVLIGNFAKINEIVRDAAFVCNKLHKNVVVELSEPQQLPKVHNLPIVVVESPKEQEKERRKIDEFFTKQLLTKEVINDFIVSRNNTKKPCLNGCGNESEKDCCSKKCSDQYKVKKSRLKKKQEEKLLTA